MRCARGVDLLEGLALGDGDLVSLVGGGGKTTFLYRAGEAMRAAGMRVAVGTTTKIGLPRGDTGRSVVLAASYEALVERLGAAPGLPVLGMRRLEGGKIQGVPAEWCDRLVEERRIDRLVIEADGAARRPLKAPEAWEPVVPSRTGVFVPVVGLSCLGRRFGPEEVFRAEKVSELTGLGPGDRIGVQHLVRILVAEQGLLKGRPPEARAVALLNQVDVCDVMDARAVAKGVLEGPYPCVILAALGRETTFREVWTR